MVTEETGQMLIGPPIDMVLFCPACLIQHIDGPTEDWPNPPHKTHLCLGCGHLWRPADVPTNGVKAIKTVGEHDSPIMAPKTYHTGLDPEMGFLLDGANEGEMAAYDASFLECMVRLQDILKGKDRGQGVSTEPWQSIRMQLIALVKKAPQPVNVPSLHGSHLPLVVTNHMMNAAVSAWHSWKSRDNGGSIQELGRLMWEHMADAASTNQPLTKE